MKQEQSKSKARAKRIARKVSIRWKKDMTGDFESATHDTMRAPRRNYYGGKAI
mgnify:CR=1 FL=1